MADEINGGASASFSSASSSASSWSFSSRSSSVGEPDLYDTGKQQELLDALRDVTKVQFFREKTTISAPEGFGYDAGEERESCSYKWPDGSGNPSTINGVLKQIADFDPGFFQKIEGIPCQMVECTYTHTYITQVEGGGINNRRSRTETRNTETRNSDTSGLFNKVAADFSGLNLQGVKIPKATPFKSKSFTSADNYFEAECSRDIFEQMIQHTLQNYLKVRGVPRVKRSYQSTFNGITQAIVSKVKDDNGLSFSHEDVMRLIDFFARKDFFSHKTFARNLSEKDIDNLLDTALQTFHDGKDILQAPLATDKRVVKQLQIVFGKDQKKARRSKQTMDFLTEYFKTHPPIGRQGLYHVEKYLQDNAILTDVTVLEQLIALTPFDKLTVGTSSSCVFQELERNASQGRGEEVGF